MIATIVKSRLVEMHENIQQLADNMAAAATTFHAHGYDQFINAREAFVKTLEAQRKELEDNIVDHD